MGRRRYQQGARGTGPLSFETGTIVKDWGGKIPVCIVFPNSYYVGMSNLAIHILYRTLNDMPDVVCERCFMDGHERPLSLEGGKPLSSFEVIFFSISFELDYINIPEMLHRAGINIHARGRGAKDPLIVGGGVCVMSNPEPLHTIFDLFIMGDIEATVPLFMERYGELRAKKRKRVVEGLSEFDWAYNPQALEVRYKGDGTLDQFIPRDLRVSVRHYKGKDLGTSVIIADKTEFSSMFLAEGTRGCPSRCPFCLIGNLYHFIHEKVSTITTDCTDIGILGGGVSFHPRLMDELRALKEAGKRTHLPSLRIDEVPLPCVELIKDEVKTLTFGIEAGTEALRRFIGKPMTDGEIIDRIGEIIDIKPFNLKLYFMVGLPGETKEDIDSIPDLAKRIKHVMVKKGAKKGVVGSITIHASPFVPKPFTPFQWLPMDDTASLKEKIGHLRKAFGTIDNTFFTHESIKHSFIQGVFARGDRRIADIVLALSSGAAISKVIKESPVNLNFYALRERMKDELFPWDFISGITSKEKLYKRLAQSLTQ
ncbi:MAG: hypothetical protein KBB65_06855 [Syntrophorhabdaceae bacterium]|nr:hypothetical protein [Syntrophorhabdaceae bacterium]